MKKVMKVMLRLRRRGIKEQKKDKDVWYERYLAEKVDPPIFARTMRERLDIDSDGEKIEGIDANGSDSRRHGGG